MGLHGFYIWFVQCERIPPPQRMASLRQLYKCCRDKKNVCHSDPERRRAGKNPRILPLLLVVPFVLYTNSKLALALSCSQANA
jgi:hypothetical protein